MTTGRMIASNIAFTPMVKAIQSRKGSRSAYARMENGAGWETEITRELAAFISKQSSIFFATANAVGQPYIQHRGGPPGFLHVLGENRIAFADFTGNRQYISMGNLAENPKVCLFLLDYSTRQRVKLWGTAHVVEDDPELVKRLMPPDYKATGEQAIIFHVDTWDANCPKHIPQRFDTASMTVEIEARDRRIAELESQISQLTHVPSQH